MSRHDVIERRGGPTVDKGRRGPRTGPKPSLKMRILGWGSIAVTCLLVATSLYFYSVYRNDVNSIHQIKITGLGKRPPKYTNALDILLIGSDTRKGANKRFGRTLVDGGQRSDSIILLHVSPGRKGAVIISFPRDTVVPTLACPSQGTGTPGQVADPTALERINATFANGGPSCLYHTVEQITHVRIDHFVQLDFVGFEHVVNDIGGVDICLPFAVNNPQSGLHLTAGKHHVRGKQALAFWRVRENIGEGSDLQRIQRDQYLMASLVQGVEKSNILGSLTRTFSVVKDVASAMTTDMDLNSMTSILGSVRGLSTKNIQFVQVPTVAYPGDPAAEVEFAVPGASDLFSAIAHDKTLPKTKKKNTGTPVLAAADPADVNVQVLNGSGANGIAATTGAALASRGFHVLGTGDASAFDYTSSVIEYASADDKPQVQALRKQLDNVIVKKDPNLAAGSVELILGADYSGTLATPGGSSPGSGHKSVDGLSKSFGGIKGNAACKSDTGAFAGPNSPPMP
jgi:LCP family protein required for cell wall assembly